MDGFSLAIEMIDWLKTKKPEEREEIKRKLLAESSDRPNCSRFVEAVFRIVENT
jgi:hypothetical protein